MTVESVTTGTAKNHSIQRIEQNHPKLMSELNDAESNVPAYVRFQSQDQCMLREDLKKLKAEHFRKSYEKHLALPKEAMEDVHFKGDPLDAQRYY